MYLHFWIYDREESSAICLLPVHFKSTCSFTVVWWGRREAGCLFVRAGVLHLWPDLHRGRKECSSTTRNSLLCHGCFGNAVWGKARGWHCGIPGFVTQQASFRARTSLAPNLWLCCIRWFCSIFFCVC